MLDGLRDAFASVQSDFLTAIQKFLHNQHAGQIFPPELLTNLCETQGGSNLLLRYQLNVEQIVLMNNENIRAANLCSTRMSRLHQLCNEQAESVVRIHYTLKLMRDLNKQIDAILHQIETLRRFLMQTDLSIAHLEAIYAVTNNESLIDMKKRDLKAEREKLNQKQEKERVWMMKQTSLPLPEEMKAQEKADTGEYEEMMLDDFLSG